MAQRLRVKRIDTVGFVDRGDDPQAEIVFWKRRDEAADQLLAGDGAGDSSADDGGTDDGATHMDDLTKLQADLDAEKARADEAVAKAAELETLLAKATEPEPEPEPLPEPIQKQLTALEKRAEAAEEKLAKMHDANQREKFIAKAEKLNALPGVNPDDFAPILRKIDEALDEEEKAKLDTVLEAANEAVKTGELYEELGTEGDATATVTGEVEKLAEEIRKANPGMSAQAARGEVWKQRPDLLSAFEEKRSTVTKHLTTED